MIRTVMRINWITLKRDRVAFALAFILPLVFFTIFGMIFGGDGGEENNTRPITLIVVDEDQSDFSHKFSDKLANNQAYTLLPAPETGPYSRESATQAVRTGKATVAVILPEKFGEGILNTIGQTPAIKVVLDPSNPVAKFSTRGILTETAMSAAPTMMMDRGMDLLAQFGGDLTERQQSAVEFARQSMNAPSGDGPGGGGNTNLVRIEFEDTQQKKGDEGPNMVAYFGAGVGVMFMLFYMAGAGGSILEEEETGTLDRLLTSRLSIQGLLLGKWLFYGIMGFLQMYLMFTWANLVFGVPFFDLHTQVGFLVLSLFAAAGASAFGMLLAAVCKSRAQLSGISTIVILMMSALGGSMVPRFVMPAFMDKLAMFTFNGWAIDGYLKLFWYKDPSHSILDSLIYLGPQLLAMTVITIGFLAASFFFARRWSAT